LSQQNWIKERDELISREAYAREEYEGAKQAMQDWEVLAMEERSMRENLGDKVLELEDQVLTIKDSYEKAAMDRDTQTQTVEGLQRALRDIQDGRICPHSSYGCCTDMPTARKKELREMVETSQAQLEEVRKQHQASEETASTASQELERARKELERALPFEREVKEKNLLIGKLRHEGVILNDHLTKALRFIKQRNPEDMVDRYVIAPRPMYLSKD
jgi:DNA repair exonuclease SbcCD ATPase subunit